MCRKGDPEQREITHKRKDKKVSDVCCIKNGHFRFWKKNVDNYVLTCIEIKIATIPHTK